MPRAKKEKQPQPESRVFRLRDSDDLIRVAFGASPRVSIGAGDQFQTSDPRLADRLAAHPELEEVTR